MSASLDILPRAAAAALDRAARVMPVVVLTGARQTGKSTLARLATSTRLTTGDGDLLTTEDGRTLTTEPDDAAFRYVSLDSIAALRLARDDPEAFVRQAERMVIDEVQRAPDLLLAIKAAIDADHPRRAGRFFLTGSANLRLLAGVRESLAGRAAYVTLWPLTRREQLAFGSTGVWSELLAAPPSAWRSLLNTQMAPEESWMDAARRGGYPTPAYQLANDEARRIWFDGYVKTYLERDIRDIADIDNLPAFETVVRSMATRTGTLVNQTQLGRDAGVPQSTVQRYVSHLEMSCVLHRLPAFTRSRAKQLVKSPKYYWVDSGLALFLSRERVPRGEHLETLIASDLLAWRDIQSNAPQVSYWRTPKGAEVDFVIDDGRRLLPIEVKATPQPSTRDLASMTTFLVEHADRAPAGLLLYTGDSTFSIAKNIMAVPWWRVL